MLSWITRTLAVGLLAGLAACGGGEEDPTVAQTLTSYPEFSILAEAVAAADLTPALADANAQLTVFAPTNDAFAALLGELGVTKAQLLADKPLLTRVLTYHVLGKTVPSANVPLGQPVATLQGGNLVASRGASGLVLTDERTRTARITATDLHARNGVVHVIDRVVLPRGTVVEMARANPDFSLLVQALDAAGLAATLGGTGPFTVFAPTNAAFSSLLQELGITREALFADRALLTQVLTYHVLSPQLVRKADIRPGRAVTPLQGAFFKIDVTGDAAVITDGRNRTSRIVATDVAATNGVIHVVDRVLLPPDRTVVQTAQALPQFSLLVEAVVAADLAGILSQPGPFTVFAPTNEAFAALLQELGVTKEALFADKTLLRQVLTYHVIAGAVLKAEVPLATPIATLQSGSFTVDATLTVTDQRGRQAKLSTTDVLASNGVIHVLDRVMLPRP
ncbi:MAG: hypothetical protein RI988_1515 [Pseudomonadota bacterium]|jgi:uncharacterized surface protein with fasciclin (FAS1) repeats